MSARPPQEHDRQYMHVGTMVEFAFALVGKLDVINKHSFNDFRLRIGENAQRLRVEADDSLTGVEGEV